MKNFDWDEFKTGDIVVHCNSKEKSNDFLGQTLKHNLMCFGKNYLTDNLYEQNNSDTCYRANGEGDILYDSLQYYYTKNYKIVEWEIGNMKEFAENDLKVGMLVKTKYCDVVGYGMIMPARRLGLAIAYKNETWETIDFGDIMEVWGYCNYAYEALKFDIRNRELLYKRKETKKMTVKEICELVGFDVEIVKG